MRFLVIPQLRGRWSWELRDTIDTVVAASAMSFGSCAMALKSIQEFRALVPATQLKNPAADARRTTRHELG